jgi:hypothetical protein
MDGGVEELKFKKTVVSIEQNSTKGIKNTIEICYYKKNSKKRRFTSKKRENVRFT